MLTDQNKGKTVSGSIAERSRASYLFFFSMATSYYKCTHILYRIWPPTRPKACLPQKKRMERRGFEPPTLGVAIFYADR